MGTNIFKMHCGTNAEKEKLLDELKQVRTQQRFMQDYIVNLDDRIHNLEVNKKHQQNKNKLK